MPLLIHIGSRKTGSKAIQKFLTRNHRQKRGEFYLPETGRRGVWYQGLYNALLEHNDTLLEELKQEVSAHPDRLSIISYEGFSKLPAQQVDKLASFFPDAQIVYFIRPQYAFINSLLNQLIKAHTITIDNIEQFTSNLIDQEPDLDVEKTYNRWAHRFSESQVKCALYSRQSDSVETFINIAGSALFKETSSNAKPTNTALSESGLITFYNLKKVLMPGDEMHKIIDLLHQQGTELFTQVTDDELFIINRATVQAIIEHYRESNTRILKHLGIFSGIEPFFHAENLHFSDAISFPAQTPDIPHLMPTFKLIRSLLLK